MAESNYKKQCNLPMTLTTIVKQQVVEKVLKKITQDSTEGNQAALDD